MLTTRKIAEKYEILRVATGSTLYGTSLPDNHDRYEIGICIPPPEYIIATKRFTQFGDKRALSAERSKSGDLHLTVFALRQWMDLAMKGRLKALETLFTPSNMRVMMTEYGLDLLARPELLVSRAVGHSCLGFVSSQRGVLTRDDHNKHTSQPELSEEFGYDPKYAYHAIRVGLEGIQLMDQGTITLPLDYRDREQLLEIRRGEYTLNEVLELINGLSVRLERAIEISQLPDELDFEKIDQMMVTLHTDFWVDHSLI